VFATLGVRGAQTSMDVYRKAMFGAYWLPVVLFFVLPNAVLLSLADSVTITEVAQNMLPFPLALFITGYLISPYFGPKVMQKKSLSFLMATVCLLVALAIYVLALSAPDFTGFKLIFPLYTTFVIFGIFPVLIGGIFYIGACEHENT
jgi:hypothetical protein